MSISKQVLNQTSVLPQHSCMMNTKPIWKQLTQLFISGSLYLEWTSIKIKITSNYTTTSTVKKYAEKKTTEYY